MKLDEILFKLSQYMNETLDKPEYMTHKEAKQAIKDLVLEIIGEEPDAKKYDLPNYMERCAYRRELLAKVNDL